MQINPKVVMAIMVLFVELLLLAAFTGLGIVTMDGFHFFWFLPLALYVIIEMLILNVTAFFFYRFYRAQKKQLEEKRKNNQTTM